MGNLKIAAVIALLAALGLGAFRIKTLSAENEKLENQVAAVEAELTRANNELRDNMLALAKREDERKRLADESAELKFKLGELYEKDTVAADWSVVDMPGSVFECLLQTLPSADPARIAACGLATGGAGAATAGPQQQ